MTIYSKVIIEATNCSQNEAVSIEEIMREDIFHSTLDWQTRSVLARAAKQAQKILKKINHDD